MLLRYWREEDEAAIRAASPGRAIGAGGSSKATPGDGGRVLRGERDPLKEIDPTKAPEPTKRPGSSHLAIQAFGAMNMPMRIWKGGTNG